MPPHWASVPSWGSVFPGGFATLDVKSLKVLRLTRPDTARNALARWSFSGQVAGMAMIRFKSKVEQVADYLRGEIEHGRWRTQIPGRLELAAELGINNKTVEAALQLLVRNGLLKEQGAGKRRQITAHGGMTPRSLRVGVLNYDPQSHGEGYLIDMVHQLRVAGHVPVTPHKTLWELGMKVDRVAKLVEETPADAWVIVGGSREVLEWFLQLDTPAFALFGRRRHVPMAGAGPDKIPAMRDMVTRLAGLGHRRIVLLVREERRLPLPGATERAFLETLVACGITPGAYHLPDWDESVEGFHKLLEELFRLTPPTALIVDEAPFFTAAMQFCARRALAIPEDVSLVCCDSNPNFSWCKPLISHIGWDTRPVVRRIVRWANNVSIGREDRQQLYSRAQFIEGGTIGPVNVNR
jgi:hypothetical protein